MAFTKKVPAVRRTAEALDLKQKQSRQIPAFAGMTIKDKVWIPAFAGMTSKELATNCCQHFAGA